MIGPECECSCIRHSTFEFRHGPWSKGPTTTDALGNTVSVAELKAQTEAGAERAAARERREAKAAAAAAGGGGGEDEGAADHSGGGGGGISGSGGGGGGGGVAGIVSLEEQLAAMQVKAAAGGKLTSKEKKMLAKAEKEGRLPDPSGANTPSEPPPPSFVPPEAWHLEAVSVHARGGGDPTEDGDEGSGAQRTAAVVDVKGLDVSIRGRGLHSFPFQLKLSTSFHRKSQLGS